MIGKVLALPAATLDSGAFLLRHRKILAAITRVELAKRYAGSAFGRVWVVLQPALLLAIYLFVYMVVFKVRFPGFSQLDYVLFVFTGLVPYLGFMEAVTTGCLSIKQNLHLVKNVMLPIELIPVRSVLVSMVGQLVSMAVILPLLAWNGSLSPHLLWLPLVFGLQVLMLIGIVWILASMAVALPDVGYFVNLFVLLLLFISPIGFKPEMIPARMQLIVTLNPIYYMAEVYRSSMLYGAPPEPLVAAVYVILCLGCFAVGGAFFRRFKEVLVDFE